MKSWLTDIAGWLMLAGWLLLGFGLVVFSHLLELAERGKITQSGLLLILGFVVFRGGIQLLKVAAASRICGQIANRSAEEQRGHSARGAARQTPPSTFSGRGR